MKRNDALALIRVAGYHEDTRLFIDAKLDGKIGHEAANAEWRKGYQMKLAGVKCTCGKCNKKETIR